MFGRNFRKLKVLKFIAIIALCTIQGIIELNNRNAGSIVD